MAASTLEELYDFEPLLEAGFRDILEDAGVTQQITIQRESENLTTPRIGLKVILGAAKEHFCENAVQLNDIWDATLKCMIVTNRTSNDAQHSTIRAKLRVAFAKWARFDEAGARWDWYEVARMYETGTMPEVSPDQNHDVSTIDFGFVFGIKNSAWPT